MRGEIELVDLPELLVCAVALDLVQRTVLTVDGDTALLGDNLLAIVLGRETLAAFVPRDLDTKSDQ